MMQLSKLVICTRFEFSVALQVQSAERIVLEVRCREISVENTWTYCLISKSLFLIEKLTLFYRKAYSSLLIKD